MQVGCSNGDVTAKFGGRVFSKEDHTGQISRVPNCGRGSFTQKVTRCRRTAESVVIPEEVFCWRCLAGDDGGVQ